MQTGRFGVVGLGLSVFLLLLAGVAVWVARHPQWQGLAQRLASSRAVDSLRRWGTAHLGEVVSGMRGRLGRHGTAAVALLGGLIAVAALAVGFTTLLEDVLEGDGVALIDKPAAQWLANHREGWLTTGLTVVTHAGGPAGQTIWLIAVCAAAAWRARSWLPVIVGVVGGVGIALISLTAKTVVGRQRPGLPFALIDSHGYSFPSGHAAGAAAVGVLCAWSLCRWVIHPWGDRVAVWALTVAAIVLIGFSRLYLGMHFLTDVLAGWLLGTAWTAAVVVIAAWWSGDRRPAPWPRRL